MMNISEKDVAVLGELVAGISSAGSPLESGIDALALDLPRGRLKTWVVRMADRLKQGESIQTLIADSKIPAHLRGLFAAGFHTNSLPLVLEEYAATIRERRMLVRKILGNLAYPVVLAVVGIVVSCALLIVFLPTVRDMFDDDSRRPVITGVLLIATQWISDHWTFLMSILLTIASIFVLLLLLPAGRWLLAELPFIRAIAQRTADAYFCRLMAIFVGNGVPMPLALRLIAGSLPKSSLQTLVLAMAQESEHGNLLGESVGTFENRLSGAGPLLIWGERHNSLPAVFAVLGQLYGERASAIGEAFSSIVPAFFYGFIICMIMFGMFAVVLPIYQAINGYGLGL